MDLTEDSFRALARSSPWRWRTLHFTRRDGGESAAYVDAEAWLRRPGHLVVRRPDGEVYMQVGLPYSTGWFTTGAGAVEPPRSVLPHEVAPTLRPDGLVAERPSDLEVDYDDPMHANFTWVAMLDPVELSHHTSVTDLQEGEVEGRPVWWAHVHAEEGYDPRCGCCPLLWSEISDRDEAAAGGPPAAPGTAYPDGYRIALDVGTGVVVRLVPVGGSRPDATIEVDIHEVDGPLADAPTPTIR